MKELIAIAEVLELAARELARADRRCGSKQNARRGRGATLRPSLEALLWNAVAAQVGPQLGRRGDRALLARESGVHCARIREYFDLKTAMPDPERARQVLIWLSRPAARFKVPAARS